MSTDDWNAGIIAEFSGERGQGRWPLRRCAHGVGPPHRTQIRTRFRESHDVSGRRAGSEDHLRFCIQGRAPTNPDWYYNLVATDQAEAEIGTETYPVSVSEVTGEKRDRIYDEQASRYPGFAEYAEKTAGIRTIPVVALTRA